MTRTTRKEILLLATLVVSVACSSPSNQSGSYVSTGGVQTPAKDESKPKPQRTRRSSRLKKPLFQAHAKAAPTPVPQTKKETQPKVEPTPFKFSAPPTQQAAPRVEPTPKAEPAKKAEVLPKVDLSPKAEPKRNSGAVAGVRPGGQQSQQTQQQKDSSRREVVLNSSLPLRTLRNEVLETLVNLPAGTKVSFPKIETANQANYRETDGSVRWSSTGFIKNIRIVSVPLSSAGALSANKINELNAISTGAYISALIGSWAEGLSGNYTALTKGKPSNDYAKLFEDSGKPKFNFTSLVQKRFGDRLNKGVSSSSLSSSDSQKWQRIYAELKRVADRTVPTPRSLLEIDLKSAQQLQSDWENKRSVPTNGAHTIATEVTAVKHGFPEVPCAEFMSELVREAYQRAGYNVSDDFSDAKGNDLHWESTAAVENFSKALYKAGWIPWDMSQYRPLTGALLMHGAGLTPGHAYIAASDDGSFIVDNGAPQGRDLRYEKTTGKTLRGMYLTGVFFLPPGINPQPWSLKLAGN